MRGLAGAGPLRVDVLLVDGSVMQIALKKHYKKTLYSILSEPYVDHVALQFCLKLTSLSAEFIQ